MLRQLVAPKFPEYVIRLDTLDGDRLEIIDFEVLRDMKNKSIVQDRESGMEFIVIGGPLEELFVNASPYNLFLSDIFTFILFWYSISYWGLVFIPTYLGWDWIWREPLYVASVTGIFVHLINQMLRFKSPYLRVLEAKEYGVYAGVKVFIPRPFPYSALSVRKELELLDKSYHELMITREAEMELRTELTMLKGENVALSTEIVKHKQSLQFLESIIRERLMKEFARELEERVRQEKNRLIIIAILAASIMLILGLALGFSVAGGGIAFAPA